MFTQATLDSILKRGTVAAIALVLVWFLMANVTDAINKHDSRTAGQERILQQICINTSVLAKRDPSVNCIP